MFSQLIIDIKALFLLLLLLLVLFDCCEISQATGRQHRKSETKKGKDKDFEGVSDPITAFLMLDGAFKAHQADLERIEEIAEQQPVVGRFLEAILWDRWPRTYDEGYVIAAAMRLFRFQDAYLLNTTNLADGLIEGASFRKPLTASECFDLGRVAFSIGDHYHSLLWTEEAWERAQREMAVDGEKEDETLHFLRSDILEHLAYALHQQGNPERAMLTTELLLKIDPEHPRAAGNLAWYQDNVDQDQEWRRNNNAPLPPLRNLRPPNPLFLRDEALCRGETAQNLRRPTISPELLCYLKRDRPFLRLAPFKVEIISLRPLAVMFRDVISDSEIAHLKARASKNLEPIWRVNQLPQKVLGSVSKLSFRIGQSSWMRNPHPNRQPQTPSKSANSEKGGRIEEEEDPVLDRLDRRMALMTNLNMDSSEPIKVLRYGIGGHFYNHHDFETPGVNKGFRKELGNRLATLIFYLVEPDGGGYTAFPRIGTAAVPTAHDALFWYNLLPSGTGDMRTEHLPCPVLLGEKWIGNKWFHEAGNEFTRPCAVSSEHFEERFVGELNGASDGR